MENTLFIEHQKDNYFLDNIRNEYLIQASDSLKEYEENKKVFWLGWMNFVRMISLGA